MSENQARIVVDNQNHKQLQIEVDTLIEDDKRRQVLLYTALRSVMEIEHDISKMAANRIDIMYEAVMHEGDVNQGDNGNKKPRSIIVLPNEIQGEQL